MYAIWLEFISVKRIGLLPIFWLQFVLSATPSNCTSDVVTVFTMEDNTLKSPLMCVIL